MFVKQLVCTYSLTTQKYNLLAKAWCNWVSRKDFFILFRFTPMPLQEYSEASCFDITFLKMLEQWIANCGFPLFGRLLQNPTKKKNANLNMTSSNYLIKFQKNNLSVLYKYCEDCSC